MKSTMGIGALLLAFGSLGYGSYRKGYSDAVSKTAAEQAAAYGNDWNGDPSVKHSGLYSLGYARGNGAGYAETRQRDFLECSEKSPNLP
jgi:hypothetical protein